MRRRALGACVAACTAVLVYLNTLVSGQSRSTPVAAPPLSPSPTLLVCDVTLFLWLFLCACTAPTSQPATFVFDDNYAVVGTRDMG